MRKNINNKQSETVLAIGVTISVIIALIAFIFVMNVGSLKIM